MSTELVPVNEKIQTIRQLLERSKPQIKMALPSHLSPDRMLRVAMTSIQKTPKLLNCTPQSLIGAIIQTSQLGLEPDGILGHAYLVPYGDVCQLIPGYKGLIQLARRSGEIGSITAEIVHAKDVFVFQLGLEPKLTHVPSDEEDEGEVIAAYAICKLKSGDSQFTVMRKGAIERIRKRSKAATSGPWVTDYEEMCKKTVLRRLCKLLPCSIEMERAVALDERAEAGLPQDLEVEMEPEQKLKAVSKLDAITPNVSGEVIDMKPEPSKSDSCDRSDFDQLEILGTECGVTPKKWRVHIEQTMGFAAWDTLTKERLPEVRKWIEAQKKS